MPARRLIHPPHNGRTVRRFMEFSLRDGLDLNSLEEFADRYDDELSEGSEELREKFDNAEQLGRDGLREIVEWKAPRAVNYVEDNDEEFVCEITATAIDAHENGETEEFPVAVLTLLAGVRVRVASAIAFFLWGEEFPVMDWRALESLSVPEDERRYTVENYLEYREKCLELGRNAGLSAREVDKALWAYSEDGLEESG